MFVYVLLCIFFCEIVSEQPRSDSLTRFNLHVRKQNYMRRYKAKPVNFNNTTFTWLKNYHVNATPVSINKYPWAARVIHARRFNTPQMCTTIGIDTAIFITAAVCIHTFKTAFSSVMVMGQRLPVIAYVLPSIKSMQGFDDIGFIVLHDRDEKLGGKWPIIDLMKIGNRTDTDHSWFKDVEQNQVKVVGYTIGKDDTRVYPKRTLTELNVVIGIKICQSVLTPDDVHNFNVPCYLSCTLDELKKKNNKCKSYHGAEGSAVIEPKSNTLIGVATWGIFYENMEMPVGFSFTNSAKFFKDFACARKIRDHKIKHKSGNYQKIC